MFGNDIVYYSNCIGLRHRYICTNPSLYPVLHIKQTIKVERKTNISIIESITPEWTLESRVAKAALGHVVRAGGMEDDVMLGRMNGTRKRGRPRQRRLAT